MNKALTEIINLVNERKDDIEQWLEAEFAKGVIPFYCSVDLRTCEYKIAPIDTNLFPGGFNNLAHEVKTNGTDAAKKVLGVQWPNAKKVAIITEHHTRNPYYTDHLSVLKDLVESTGMEVRLAFFDGQPNTLEGHHKKIEVGSLKRVGDKLFIDDFEPDLVILNYDQTSGTLEILDNLSQSVTPPPQAGWAHRRKSIHFFQYERVLGRFCRSFGLDSWLLEAYFNVCSRVDISKNIGLDCLARSVEETLSDIKSNHERLGIDVHEPFVVLKADAGTYGMGVVMVDDPEATKNLNRRQRQGLSVIKEGVSVNDILVQEGVPTTDRIEGLVAEPVYYMVGTDVIGGFWRLNQSKHERENLNSRGMLFWPMHKGHSPDAKLSYIHRVVARLALLATTRELADEFARGGEGS